MKNRGLLRYGGFLFSATAARIASILITSVTFPYLVRILGVETYGLWSYVVAISAFLEIVADPGLTTHITRQVSAQRYDASELLPDYFALRLCGAVVGAVCVMTLAHWEVRPDVSRLLRIYGVGLLITNLVSSDHFLAALEMFHARSILAVAQQTVYAAIIFLLIRKPADVAWLPFSILGSSAAAGAIGWMILWRKGLTIPTRLQPLRWKQILVPSVHYAASTLMSSLYHRAGHVLVRFFLGDYALGLYAAATRLVDLLRSFVTTLVSVLTPRLAFDAQSEPTFKRTSRFAVTAMAAVSIPMAVGLAATARQVVPWFLGANYLPDVRLVQWMSPYIVTASAASLWSGTLLYAMGRHRAYLFATAGGALSGVILYFLLIPPFGLMGAGAAFVLAELAVAAIGFGLLPEPLRDLWKNPVIAIALSAAALMWVFVKLGSTYSLRLPLLIAGGALVYALPCGLFVRRWFHRQLSTGT